MQFTWSQSVIHFSLITITDRPPKQLSRKHFCSYLRQEEGLLGSRRAEPGEMQDPELVSVCCSVPPLCPRDASGIWLCFQHCWQPSLRCHPDVFYTHYVLMDAKLWKSGADSLPACVITTRATPTRPAASPLAPAGVNHASLEPDSSGEITL